jgi:hypothetical protein
MFIIAVAAENRLLSPRPFCRFTCDGMSLARRRIWPAQTVSAGHKPRRGPNVDGRRGVLDACRPPARITWPWRTVGLAIQTRNHWSLGARHDPQCRFRRPVGDSGANGKLGHEAVPRHKVESLVEISKRAMRDLQPSGVSWLGVGDVANRPIFGVKRAMFATRRGLSASRPAMSRRGNRQTSRPASIALRRRAHHQWGAFAWPCAAPSRAFAVARDRGAARPARWLFRALFGSGRHGPAAIARRDKRTGSTSLSGVRAARFHDAASGRYAVTVRGPRLSDPARSPWSRSMWSC